jgi:hypothetical protein
MVETGYTDRTGRRLPMELIAAAVALLAVFAQVAAIAGWESRDGFDDAFGDTSTFPES